MKKNIRDRMIGVAMSASEVKRLKKYCKSNGITLSSFCRELILKEIML